MKPFGSAVRESLAYLDVQRAFVSGRLTAVKEWGEVLWEETVPDIWETQDP